MSLTPQALRLLTRELATLRSDPPEGVRVVLDEEDISCIEGWVQGPAGTPYDGGYFKVKFNFGSDYPSMPPKCTMMTKIFHPNVSKAGEICVDTLKKGWKKEYGVGHVLVTIKCLLIYPNPESALDEEAGKQLLADYEGYCKYARLMTSIHATPKTSPPEFRESLSKASSSRSTPAPPATSTSTSGYSKSASPAPLLVPITSATTRPAPLGQTLQQEQSPSISTTPTFSDAAQIEGMEKDDGLKKTAVKAQPVKVVKKVAATSGTAGAKRGLKRL